MADRPSFEEIVEGLREGTLEPVDAADQLDRFYGKSTLREDAGRAAELEKQLIAAQAKITKLERGPQLTKAFAEYGVDMEGLRPAEQRALETYDGELDPERIAAFVQEYDLPLLTGPLETEQEPQVPAQRIAAQAAAPQARRGPARQQITPDIVRQWNESGPEKWMRFKQSHPEAAELILQGQTVEGLVFD
jgi:hypothetical protein